MITPREPDTNVAVISWDHARYLNMLSKTFEKMNDRFASALEFNVSLFDIVDDSTCTQHSYVYGEEHDSKGAYTVASMVYHYLTNTASSRTRSADRPIITTEGCGAENRNKTVC